MQDWCTPMTDCRPTRPLAAKGGAIVLASVLSLASIFAFMGGANAQEPARGPQPSVLVTGEGTKSLIPDIATLTLSVVTPGDTAPEALAANSEKLGKVQAKLKEIGLEERDMQTSGFGINPRYSNRSKDTDEPVRIIGYEVRNGLRIKVRDLSNLSPVLNAVVSAGANQMSGISFEASDPREAMDTARLAAIADARAKATLYAEAAGATLGKVLMIEEQGAGRSPVPVMRAEMTKMSADVPIQAGETTVTANVSVRFELVPQQP